MLAEIARWTTVCFGIFFIVVAFVMLFRPRTARSILRKAGSTNFINYAEITVRIIPALALILSADLSRYPTFIRVFGWFMLLTSLVLYFVPRHLHHNFSTNAADILKPIYFQFISPVSLFIGIIIIYCVI